MRGGLAESWTKVDLGTRGAIERAPIGNSPPKVARAAILPDYVEAGLRRPVVGDQRQARLRRGPWGSLGPQAAVTQDSLDHLRLMRLDAARSPDPSAKQMILIWPPHRG